MNRSGLCLAIILACSGMAFAQSTLSQVAAILDQQIYKPEVVSSFLQRHMRDIAPRLPAPKTSQEWTNAEEKIREQLLSDVVFHGWPKEWVDAPPKFEDLGEVQPGKGFTRRKLRYEVVPGFMSTAILYEPANLRGKAPAVLNVTGHVGKEGKAVEYEQKRCINLALEGIVALNLEWIGQGELSAPEDQHFFVGHLDLVGANGVGLFYLEMRRGLDYLAQLPEVDSNRLGMTGLSGGGWQTMFLSALDKRVKVAVPVAGYDTLADWIPRLPAAAGDNEQAATDVLAGHDYAILTAMRAPRPTLLVLNAEDDCCFRAALVKPFAYDAIKPFFALYGAADSLQFHENMDPSTHNYQMDNRLSAYEFFAQHFNMPRVTEERPVGSEILSSKDLQVGLPADNFTLLTLAQEMARRNHRPPVPSEASERSQWAASAGKQLAQIIREEAPVRVSYAGAVATTKSKGVESQAYRFELSNNLPATGIWVKSITASSQAPVSIVLNDQGKKSAADVVMDRVNRSEQVLALDLIFTGDSSTEGIPRTWAYPEMLSSLGERPLGIEAGQLLALAHWIMQRSHAPKIRLETTGLRAQLVAMVASALEPGFFSSLKVHEGMSSLNYLLTTPVHYDDAADIFCLDLYKDFDLDAIAALAAPTIVSYESYDKPPSKERAN